MRASDLPSYKDLPSVKGMPPGTARHAWGLFDHDGVKDEVGTINLLTPEVVVNAKKEIHDRQERRPELASPPRRPTRLRTHKMPGQDK